MANSPSPLVLAPSPTEQSEPPQIQSATIGGATDFSDTVAWIYTGTGAIQQSINPAIIGPLCVGVIRGQVTDRAGVAMAGVQVSIHGRDDYGYTTTQNDGRFSLAVNGGETFVVNYVRNGYLPVQRQVTVPRREYAWADPVALVPLDSKVTTIAPDAATMQVITGNTVNDSDGQRTATLLVPAGTSAEMVMADGSTQPLGQLAIRATEYTVGDTGPDAMPGDLPARSGYTYALEYSVDAALSAGATSVRFDQPIFHYVENFLDLPAGTPVPMGYYDRAKARWVASNDGVIITIVGESGGLAQVDSNGDAVADTLLGMETSELQALASRYNPGVSLWRVAIDHFTPWDCNWPFSPPADAIAPGDYLSPGTPGAPAGSDARDVTNPESAEGQPNDNPCNERASIIGCQSQTLGEEIAITGTPYRLVYRSDRVRGRTAATTIQIPLTGATPPASLKRVVAEIEVAGKREVREFAPAANLQTTYAWDGYDAYGSLVQGQRPIQVRIGYVYDGVYNQPASGGRSFGRTSGVAIEGNRARQEVTLYRTWQGRVGSRDERDLGLGGWVPDVLHRYDPEAHKLYFGSGEQRTLDSEPLGSVVEIVAGGGNSRANGVPARQADLSVVYDTVAAPDGTIYLADSYDKWVRKVSPDGIITTVAGTGTCCTVGDGRPAIQARLEEPSGLAIGPDGRLYIADTSQYRIRRIEANGTIATVAGTGECCTEGDGGTATQANLQVPVGVSFGPDGSFYIADWYTDIIRKVDPNGIITRVAGGGSPTYPSIGDGGPATQAALNFPYDTAVGPDGSLYIADNSNHRIRKVAPNGIISTIAGTGSSGFSGDGGPATAARLSSPKGLDFGSDGSLYIADSVNYRIRKIAPDGTISTVAGSVGSGSTGDGGPATAAKLYRPTDIDVTADGTIYIADTDNHRIRKVTPAGIISTVAGSSVGFGGDGGPATQARMRGPERVVLAADGSLYIADTGNSRIRRVAPNGTITSITGVQAIGDGGPATQAELRDPVGLTLGPDGSLYISDREDQRIRRVAPDGTISTFAGTGIRIDNGYGGWNGSFGGDGGPALQAGLYFPYGITIDGDGTLYIADRGNDRIRAITPDGMISTVAGSASNGFAGDGGPAAAARLNNPTDVTLGPDGSFYIADTDNYRARRVSPSGIISTVAGGGTTVAQTGIATALKLQYVASVAVTDDGTLFVSDKPGSLSSGTRSYVYAVAPDGTARAIAGGGYCCGYTDGTPALVAGIQPYAITLHPDRTLLIADINGRLSRLRPALPDLPLGATIIPSEDGRLLFDFDGRGYHLRTRDALTGGTLLVFRYDAAMRLSAIISGDGIITTIARDSSGEPTAITSHYGARTTLTLDTNGYLANVISPLGSKTSLTYAANGLLKQLTDPRGNISQYEYDSLGYLTRAMDRAGGTQTLVRTAQAGSEQVVYTNQLGHTTRYTTTSLSEGGLGHSSQSPAGLVVQTNQPSDGRISSIRPDGSRITGQLSADPRLGALAPIVASRTITTPGGLTFGQTLARTVTTQGDGAYSQRDRIMVNGQETTVSFESTSLKLTVDTPASNARVIQLDAQGRSLQVIEPAIEALNYRYDAHGRIAEISSGDRVYHLSYNEAGQLSRLRDPLGNTTSYYYDADGHLLQQIQPDGGVVRFAYDASSNLISLTPPGRPSHTFSYTPDDLTASYTAPDIGMGSTQTQYSYNAARQITRITRPDGQTIDFTYDTAGRLSGLTTPHGQTTYSYQPVTGNLAGIAAPGGVNLAYMYDGALLLNETWSGPVAGTVERSYDNSFRVVGTSVNGVDTIAFQYDSDGLLTRAGNLQLTRSSQNSLLTETTLGSANETWTYNSFGEPASYRGHYGVTTLYNVTYTRDSLGRITQKIETIGGVTTTYAYSYDLAGRLVEVRQDGAPVEQYSYDSNGNRLSATVRGVAASGSYDNQDRLLSYGGSSYSYNAHGDLVSKTTGGQTTTYQYDVQGNLVGVTLPNSTQISYLIDGQNRRIGKKVNGVLVQGWLYADGLKPIAELDGAGTTVSRFVYAGRANAPDFFIRNGATYRIFHDQLGSPRLVVNIADGSITQRLDYDAFGNVLQDTNPGFQPFGFAGGLYDRDTGLVRFGARDYDPLVGRWTAKDPIGFEGMDSGLYSYAHNDPVNRADPSGLFDLLFDLWEGIVGLFTVGPMDVFEVDSARDTANNAAKNHPGSWGGEADAVRHCVWNCEMSRRIGPGQARAIADNHEWLHPPEIPGQCATQAWKERDRAMDNANNSFGIMAGQSKGGSCTNKCTNALNVGRLQVNSPGGY